MKRINMIWIALILGSYSILNAHDFTATTPNGQKLYFNITNKVNKQVELTFQGSISSPTPSPYKGDIVIPSAIKHNNALYRVTSIGQKAFSNATSLKSIVLPSGLLSINDFAFEGCTSLENIVFPGNAVRFGEGTFFRCNAISQVTLGSDWTQVNLKMFRWSNRLSSLFIPAKIQQLQNMKALKCLKEIKVDDNNPKFTTIDGILYNKTKSILLGCPRGYVNKIKVPEGVETIHRGAFIDCPNITSVDLPASLNVISFREFSRMKHLTQIIMRSEKPLLTAGTNNKKRFLLQVSDNRKTKLIVPKAAQDTYKEAICSTEGEYTELSGNTPNGTSPDYTLLPLTVKANNLLDKKSIIGVKNFSKYE